MKSYAVIGCGFGDEGKGRVVDYLCQTLKHPLVIRFSGGHQAGHHVIRDNISHVFSNFGSGSLLGVPTYWSKYCTIDPIGIVNEASILNQRGIHPLLYINKNCPITTTFDKHENTILEMSNNHGSCGVGFGATLQREEDKYSLIAADLFNPSIFKLKLNLIKDYYKHEDVKIDEFKRCCNTIVGMNAVRIINDFPQRYDNYIFEGSQGLLLDQNIGFFPHVTRSNTGSQNILDMGFTPHIYLVTRAYQTRHGNGPMTNEDIPHNIKENPYEMNASNGFQGAFRRSLLDIDLLKYGINRDPYIRETPNKSLVITCLDLVENEYRFTVDGEIINCINEEDFVGSIQDHLNIPDVYVSHSPCDALHLF